MKQTRVANSLANHPYFPRNENENFTHRCLNRSTVMTNEISAVSKQRRLLKKKIYFWWQIQCKLIWKLNCPDNTIVNLFIPFQMKGSGVVNRVTAPCFRKIQMKLLFIGGLTGRFKRLLTPVFVRLIQWHYNTGCAQLQGASAQQLWCLV